MGPLWAYFLIYKLGIGKTLQEHTTQPQRHLMAHKRVMPIIYVYVSLFTFFLGGYLYYLLFIYLFIFPFIFISWRLNYFTIL